MMESHHLSAQLETAFMSIQRERMADIPILNQALKVQAVGFRTWQDGCLGVLITPWFMNLVLLPAQNEEWAGGPPGTKIKHVFPSGTYEFIISKEEGIGHYQMCSLFSPVFEFQNQEAAVATAQAVMEGLMDEANRDDTSTRASDIHKIWHGEDTLTEAESDMNAEITQRPDIEDIDRPMSRRDLLRGSFLGGGN